MLILDEGTWLITWGSNRKAWVYCSGSSMFWASPTQGFLPLTSNFAATKLSVSVSSPAQLQSYVCSQVGAGTQIYTESITLSGSSGSYTCPT